MNVRRASLMFRASSCLSIFFFSSRRRHTRYIGDWSSDVCSSDLVFVAGCGPIGCFAVGIARAAGAAKVIASDVNAKRLALAQRMGAHLTIDATRDDVVRSVLAEPGGEGAGVV